MADALHQFHPVIARWFEEALGLPTPPQTLGWPEIMAGQSTLILAPTGSGKTLAAFLAGINALAARLLAGQTLTGVRMLYISPLKSLANDVERNLLGPLEALRTVADRMGRPWPEITVGVRTGDTPQKTRAALLREPPHILITTPESLNLLLTSAGRKTLRTVEQVIVDEVHALAGTKRGVFLSLLLERLEHEHAAYPEKPATGPPKPLTRIGLSATARPPERIARWLGGIDDAGVSRPVSVVNAGQRKRLDLEVLCPWANEDDNESSPDAPAPGLSHWPAVARSIVQLIHENRSTLVFVNSRRLVERLVKMLQEVENAPELLPHHGSISKAVRLETEALLKAGKLPAVVATSSLELGVDIGALDLVCQVDSPGSVAAGLQRVGRAGHLEKATAKGRLIPRTVSDLGQLGAVVPLMIEGTVEESSVPQNCLDVLAQHVVATCATGKWDRKDLLTLVRRSACYADLPEEQFNSVLTMLAPRVTPQSNQHQSTRPRIAWDRVNDVLIPLPGSARLALTNGGVIADTGQFPVYVVPENKRIGELDEEFVWESKEGDRIVLGSQTWMIQSIDVDRVTVVPATRGTSRMPFWRGEAAPRSPLLGEAIARFYGEVEAAHQQPGESVRSLLTGRHKFSEPAADVLQSMLLRQRATSAVPTDKRIVVEHFHDKAGERVIAILCPLGTRVNHVLRLALEAAFADRHLPAQVVHNDDGIVIRPPTEGNVPDNLLELVSSERLEPLVTDQLEQSALFGLRFRQNAARALMLPRPDPTRRTPLWQQRLRARNLLAVVKQQRNFPIVVETYRECLQDVLMIDRARALLQGVEKGDVAVSVQYSNQPSPLARGLWMSFEQAYLYQWDDPLASGRADEPTVDKRILDQILKKDDSAAGPPEVTWTDDDVAQLQRRISGVDFPARTPEELLEKLAAAGAVEMGPPADPRWHEWTVTDPVETLEQLQSERRLVVAKWRGAGAPAYRYIATESLGMYRAALGARIELFTYTRRGVLVPLEESAIPPALLKSDLDQPAARVALLEGEVRRSPTVTIERLKDCLPFMAGEVPGLVEALVLDGGLTRLNDTLCALPEYVDQLRAMALRRARRGITALDLSALQRHLLAWQNVNTKLSRPPLDALEDTLDALAGVPLPLPLWERDVLPPRVPQFQQRMLEDLSSQGHWVWIGSEPDGVAFLPRQQLAYRPPPGERILSASARRALQFLRDRGASFQIDMELELAAVEDLRAALRELAFAGLISNDRLDGLRELLKPEPKIPAVAAGPGGRYPNTFSRHAGGGRPKHAGRLAANAAVGGRWFVLPPAIVPSDALDLAQRAADRVDRFLRRTGFACRELLEPAADGPWRDCYDVLARMEWAQSVRRGYFISGISGTQFALPGVKLDPSIEGITWLALLDPANIYARADHKWVDASGNPARVPRTEGSWIALENGVPMLAATGWGQTLIPLSTDEAAVMRAVAAVPELLERLPRNERPWLAVHRWGGQDVVGSPADPALRAAGFVRDPSGLKLYRSFGAGKTERPPSKLDG